MEPFLRNTTNASKFDNRVHETGTDSNVGETIAADGVHLAGLSDGHRLVAGSVPTHPQGRCGGRGRSDRGGIRTGPGGQPSTPARPREVRHVPAPPVRRVHIPKGGSTTETRPIGIPTLEDKILQRAVVMLLEPIYEQDFLDCSYGFRPGRSAHQALESFRDQTMDCRRAAGCWRSISESSSTLWIMAICGQFLQLRVRDGVLLRLIGKWLKAGVMEDGSVSYPDSGSPQGGVISPLLSNVFLHYVLDLWFEQEVKPRLRGRAFLIRYADDCAPGNVHVR